MPTLTPILELIDTSKGFPGVQALSEVSLRLYPGVVTALIGENGAGKSTLVKILTGIYRPDEGQFRLDGAPVSVASTDAAAKLGITAIHQETVLFDELTVTENIFAGHELRHGFGFLDWPEMRRQAAAVLAELEADIDPSIRLRDLGIAQRHMVAIARALSVDARIVIMDEPTAALSFHEVQELFAIIAKLKAEGKAILFISHKFEEIFEIADNYTVLRDGRLAGDGSVREASPDALITMMVGRQVSQIFPKVEAEIGPPVLEVAGLCHPTEFADISFTVRRGEILGFYGLIGAGRSEVMQAIFGANPTSAGTVRLNGREVRLRRPSDATEAGIVYVPEERGRQGAVLPLPIFQNITLPSLHRTSRRGLIDLAAELSLARKYAERLELRAASLSQPVGTLSGGNQQKVVVAKWLATEPEVIILDEPTKGIDVGSKAAVHAFMSELVGAGLAVIMVSSELPEIMGMSDRVIVMRQGRIVGEYGRAGLDAEVLVRAATGNLEAAA